MATEVKTIAQRVIEVTAQQACTSVSGIDADKALEDNGLDSLDRVEFVMALEDEFGIQVSDQDAQQLDKARLTEWISYVEARRTAAQL